MNPDEKSELKKLIARSSVKLLFKILINYKDVWAEAEVSWLWEKAPDQKVVSSNPRPDTGWTFFTLNCCKKLNGLFEKTKCQQKRGRGWPIFILKSSNTRLALKYLKQTGLP